MGKEETKPRPEPQLEPIIRPNREKESREGAKIEIEKGDKE